MKKTRKVTAFILACTAVVYLLGLSAISAEAHPQMLDISYDNCVYVDNGDGINEAWYAVDNNTYCWHIDHETDTIKYYFEESFLNGLSNWDAYTGGQGTAIKTAYANSMEKWNDVYFYYYDDSGNVTKKKVINVIAGTSEDSNVYIYPYCREEDGINRTFAATEILSGTEDIVENNGVQHLHISKWKMSVNVYHFYSHNGNDVSFAWEKTGAHELGHVLGLRDIENYCNANTNALHHEEILMGYGYPIESGTSNITYKDIAGVAITRGFHTDDDHQWLNCGVQSNGKYKWICAICNGTKVALSTGFHPTYGSCGDNHDLADGNMMAVASYGTKDYYKCKYCRYVAPFANNVEQNYVATAYKDEALHWCVNNITGLEYTTDAAHSYDDYAFVDSNSHIKTCACGSSAEEAHSYICRYRDSTTHTATCACGDQQTLMHWIKESELTGGRYERCAACGAWIDTGSTIVPVGPFAVATKITANGSYILPSGIAVIVDADVEAYINGTLVFYNPDELPVTQ